MLNWFIRNRTVWSIDCMSTNDGCLFELFVIAILGTISLSNWIVKNRTVWSFNSVSTKCVYKSYIWYIYVKTGFGIK